MYLYMICTYMHIHACKSINMYIYIYTYETCAWTPNNVFVLKIVVESLLCSFKWTSQHPFARSAENRVWVLFRLRHLGLGTWQPAILKSRLGAAGLRHLGSGIWQPVILESRLWAAGPRHQGLGTWQPAILKYRLWASGHGHLGLGTWQPAILTSRGLTIEAK